jgi:peptide/nickel transport system permease protein
MTKNSFIRVLVSRWTVLLSAIIILLFIFTAIFAKFLTPYDPKSIDLFNRLAPPSWEHLLGADLMGRDILSRIIYGAQTSLLIAFVSIVIGGIIGTVLGLIAGYFGGIVDTIIMRVTDAMMAIPQIVLALGISVALGQSTLNLMIALGVSSVPAYIRMMRGQTLSTREQMYVTAARVIGCLDDRLMFRHIVPNCISPLIVTATINLGGAIMAEASLSYLGLGIAPPTPAWGSMVSEGFDYIQIAPMLSIAPGVCIMLVVLAFNILGDGLRDMLDPRIRGSL